MDIILTLQFTSSPFQILYIYKYHIDHDESTVKKLIKRLLVMFYY